MRRDDPRRWSCSTPQPGRLDDVEEQQERPNIVDRTLDRVDSFQRRIPPVAAIHAVLRKYGEDRGGQLATLLSYRGFFSVFPLMLAFVGAVGLLLDDNPELRDELIDSTLAAVPVVGAQIASTEPSTEADVIVVVGAVLLSLWTGLGLLEMLQEALNDVWGVPRFDRPPWIIRRLRAIPGALLIGGCLVLTGASAWIFGDADLPLLQRALGYLLPVLAGGLCYLGLHALLCVRTVPVRAQLPGAVATGVLWLALQLLGTWFVNRYVLQSSDTYGVFVVMFGLLSWAYMLGMAYLYANELSVVLHDRLWPRSLTGRNLTDADQSSHAAVVSREARIREMDVEVVVPRLPR
ncbi:MAG: YihY/virulence factor BrkB family protein [Microthrixaceae bacterium]|nr:YihY/virulence factor BrkB family protein [Microthrixaceae bacterium]